MRGRKNTLMNTDPYLARARARHTGRNWFERRESAAQKRWATRRAASIRRRESAAQKRQELKQLRMAAPDAVDAYAPPQRTDITRAEATDRLIRAFLAVVLLVGLVVAFNHASSSYDRKVCQIATGSAFC